MEAETNLQLVYSILSQNRLDSAGSLLRQNPDCPTDLSLEVTITRCNIAMQVWTAAVDIGSSLMIPEERRIPTGSSREITLYVTRTVARQFPTLDLRTMWRRLLWLHNVQHRADHGIERFVTSCQVSFDAFARINEILAPGSRLAPQTYEWLESVGIT